MGYWDATDDYLNRHGEPPTCPTCKQKMFPQDDHGRFTCFCNIGGGLDVVTGMQIYTPKILQLDVSGMSDEEKSKISPLNRLESTPTEAEAKFLSLLLQGPEAMDSPEYIKTCQALEKERGK
jgi:hypothetical protein